MTSLPQPDGVLHGFHPIPPHGWIRSAPDPFPDPLFRILYSGSFPGSFIPDPFLPLPGFSQGGKCPLRPSINEVPDDSYPKSIDLWAGDMTAFTALYSPRQR